MTKEEALKKIEELKAFIKQEEKPKGRWKPEIGNRFFFMTANGSTFTEEWRNYQLDKELFAMGNVFKTEEEAEREYKKRKVIAKLWDLNNGFAPDWSDSFQSKYSIAFSHSLNRFGWRENATAQEQFTLPYFASEEDAKNAIDTLGDELNVLIEG